LWRESVEIENTLAAAYLARRHVLEPALQAGDVVLWFRPKCLFGADVRHPCLLALMRDICSAKPHAGITESAPEGPPQVASVQQNGSEVVVSSQRLRPGGAARRRRWW
jgi:hypothetical protein